MSDLLIGQPVLISIDHQNAGYNLDYAIPQMGGYEERVVALLGQPFVDRAEQVAEEAA